MREELQELLSQLKEQYTVQAEQNREIGEFMLRVGPTDPNYAYSQRMLDGGGGRASAFSRVIQAIEGVLIRNQERG